MVAENVRLQDMTKHVDEQFLIAKNSIMTSLAGASSNEEFASLIQRVADRLSDDEAPKWITISSSSNSSVGDVVDNYPYANYDINDSFLDMQPY